MAAPNVRTVGVAATGAEATADVAATMAAMGRRARSAMHVLGIATTEQKNAALVAMATAIRKSEAAILAANADDLKAAKAVGISGAFVDRLTLNPARIAAMADGIDTVAALRDPALGRALGAIHEQPGRDWTVARLAREVGQSRSAFAAAFTETLGQTPLAYLTSWRMTVAARLLRETTLGIAAVAHRVGYRNPYAFATAFRRVTGAPPGKERRRTRAA